MKIRSLLITVVLVTAILCSAGFVSAQIDNSALIAQLQAQIANLMAQIRAIQAQQGTTPAWCHAFNGNLGVGATGNEVNALIKALANDGDGGEIQLNDGNYKYSEVTASAVVKFQQKYGINPTGYVGPLTRAKLNALYKCGMACIGEGGTVTGPVSPAYATVCCSGLVAQYPNNGLMGSSGICVRPGQSSITINSVSGPNSLNVGQTGTWTVNASAPSGTNLTYSVDWGDSVYPTAVGNSMKVSQAASLTYTYNRAGTYTVKFSVNDTTKAGVSAQTSLTVVVGNNNVCAQDMYTCSNGLSVSRSGPNCEFICPTTQMRPSITVTSPNGGESWKVGETHNITWNSSNTNSVSWSRINLVRPGTGLPSTTIATFVTPKNSYLWTIPNGIEMGNYYEVSVDLCTTGDPIVGNCGGGTTDYSNNYFSITKSTTQPLITSLSPSTASSGTTVTIYGRNLTQVDNIFYYPQNHPEAGWNVDASYRNDDRQSFVIPQNTNPGLYYVRIWQSGSNLSTNELPLTISQSATVLPTITGITPNTGSTGSVITVSGTNLSGASSLIFYQNGQQKMVLHVPAFFVMSSTQLTFTLDSTAVLNEGSVTPYSISVVTPAGTSTQYGSFTIFDPTQPVITSVTQTPGIPSHPSITINISGTGFTSSNQVHITSVSGISQYVSPRGITSNAITFEWPSGLSAGYYRIAVSDNGVDSNYMTLMINP